MGGLQRGRGFGGRNRGNRGHHNGPRNNQKSLQENFPPTHEQNEAVPVIKRRKVVKPHVIPKSATVCLKELCPTVKFDIKDGTNGQPYMVITDIGDGKQFKGYGSSQQMAIEASSEVALISFLQIPDNNDTDNTPWGVLTSFSVYKLLKEWKEVKDRTYDPKEFEAPKETIPTEPPVQQTKPLSERLQFPKGKQNNEEKGKEKEKDKDKETPKTPIKTLAEGLKKLKTVVADITENSFSIVKVKPPNKPQSVKCTLSIKDKKYIGEDPDEATAKLKTAQLAINELVKA